MARALFGRARPWLWLWPYLFVAICFIASRLIYRGSFGLRFDGSPLFYFIQYMDPWFIENDFLRSNLYLHSQGPIPNFFVGLVYLIFGERWWYYVLDGVLISFGLVLALALLTALIRFGTPRAVAAPIVAVFMATPVAVLYEMWLFYHVPVACLLLCALLALFRFYRLGTFRAGLLFFGLLAAIAFIRNVYGSVWVLAITAVLLVVPPKVFPQGSSARRTVLKAAAVPLVLLFALGARPRLLLGPGMGDAAIWTNIVYKTWPEVPVAERERLQEEGQISNSVNFEPYQGVNSLRGLRVKHEPTGIPLLDMATVPNGRGNTHTLEYLLIANKYYKPEGKYLLEHYPDAYVRSVIWSLTEWYPSSPTRDIVMPSTVNYHRIKRLEIAFNRALLLNENGRLDALLVLLPVAILYGIYRVFRLRAVLASERSIVVGILFMLLTIFYAALGTTMVSSGDFSRYRFDVDPFYLILLVMLATHVGVGVARLVGRFRRRRAQNVALGAAQAAAGSYS